MESSDQTPESAPSHDDSVVPWWQEIEDKLNAASGYDGTAEAALDATVLAFEHAAGRLGLTGFQASWVMLHAYAKAMHIESPVAVFKGEDLLYPQYDLPGRLAEWIKECEPWLAEEAQKKLGEDKDKGHAVSTVREHWRKLARRRFKTVTQT